MNMDVTTRLIWILLAALYLAPLHADTKANEDSMYSEPVSEAVASANAHSEYQIAPPENWVKVQTFTQDTPTESSELPKDVVDTHYLFYDRQTNALGPVSRYYHLAFQVLNETSVEENGQHFFDFAPSYEQLTFHSFNVIREGQVINQLNPEQIKLLQRETEAEGLIYNGELSASLIIEDLRPGDIIEYSYTIAGQNPAIKDHFYEYLDLQWGTPVKSLSYSLLWPNERPIHIKKSHTDVAISETEIKTGSTTYKRISVQQTDAKPLPIDSQTPSNYNPRARISLSSNDQWSNIVEWALPLYSLTQDAPLLDPIVEQIQQEHASAKQQVSAALHYVQDNIRYLGLEIGNHSLVPIDINTTLEKRYGDCKGKTLLLLNLLARLDIESYPALVNNDYITTFNDDGVRIGAFNHVLVTAFVDGKQYWLDPTINNQEPNLDRLHQPDYGQALILKPGQTDLTLMDSDQSATLKQVKEVFDLSYGIKYDGRYTIDTTMTGYEAELFRRELETSTQEEISKRYLNFYNYYYPNIAVETPLSIDYRDDAYHIREAYSLPKPWQAINDRHEVDFYANNISTFLSQPKTTIRTTPYLMSHPVRLAQNIQVKLHQDTWDLPDETDEIKNPYFSFTRTVHFDEQSHTLELDFHYQTHQNTVPVADFAQYLEDLNRASDLTGYGLYWGMPALGEAEPDNTALYFAGFYLLTLLLIIVAIVLLIREKPPTDDKVIFYPVDPTKFLVLSVLTLGIFPLYWMYKCWQFVKKRDQSTIMPVARAIFSFVWFYPLAKQILLINKEQLSKRDHALILLLTVIFIASVIISYSQNIYTLLALAMEILCIFFLALKVNQHNPVRSVSYQHNSQWRVRHAIAGLPLSLYLAFYVASTVSFIPNSQVVDGNQLWEKDLKFMYRSKILEPDERLSLFYSADLFSYEKEGNGLTDRKVFSYWKNGDGNIVKEYAYFDEIEEVSIDSQSSSLIDSSVVVTRQDGSSFVLYLSKEGFGDKRFVRTLKKYVY